MVGLAQTHGVLLKRQSDRDMPRSIFSGGIRGSYLQAHEMTGVMLVLAVCIRSRAGRDALRTLGCGDSKSFFDSDNKVKNWIAMLETHLMFEEWLRKEELQVASLELAKTKVRDCLLYTSPSPRDLSTSRMPSSA